MSASNTSFTSTATTAQRNRMVLMLQAGEKSTFDFRRAGIMQSSTRVFELRALGHDIRTVSRRDMFDTEGLLHKRVAVYALFEKAPCVGLVTCSEVSA